MSASPWSWGLRWPRAISVTTCRARGEPLWLRTNSAFFLSFTEALPVRNFSSIGTASSESLCIRLLMAMSFISSSDCDSTAGRWPELLADLDLERPGVVQPPALRRRGLELGDGGQRVAAPALAARARRPSSRGRRPRACRSMAIDALEVADRLGPLLLVDGVGAARRRRPARAPRPLLLVLVVAPAPAPSASAIVDVESGSSGSAWATARAGRAQERRQRGHGERPSHAHQLTFE